MMFWEGRAVKERKLGRCVRLGFIIYNRGLGLELACIGNPMVTLKLGLGWNEA